MRKLFLIVFPLLTLVASIARSKDITSTLPIVLPEAGQTGYIVTAGSTENVTSRQSVLFGPGTQIYAGAVLHGGVDLSMPDQPGGPPSDPVADADKNWIMTRSYDEDGNEIAASKQFYDTNGKATQGQVKNETTQQVLASQTIYDFQGRAAVSTLAAPVNSTVFGYKDNFVTAGGSNYSYLNFDGDPANTSNPYLKTNAPDAVDNSTPGTLGYYYSNTNTQEPMVATTGYPYSRGDFYNDGTGAVKRSAGVDQLRMGSQHETMSNSFPVQNELNVYLAIRNKYFPDVTGSSPTSMAGQALQTVATDQNGTSALAVTDLSGKQTLMTGRADANGWLTVSNTATITNTAGQYSFTLVTDGRASISDPSPAPGTGGQYINQGTGFSISSANTVNVYQGGMATPVYTGSGNNFAYTPTNQLIASHYQITSAYPFTISAADQSGNAIYDQAESIYTEPAGSSIHYFQLATPSAVTITGAYSLWDMKQEKDITTTYQANPSASLQPGYYKVIASPSTDNSTNTVTVSYTNKYSDISYNYYNQLGQLIGSIAPNGVQALIPLAQSNNLPATPTFISTYQYDLQGRLSSSTTTDGGTSNFVYRQDGKIRFSQNSYQANPANAGGGEKFSYTSYDSFGRPVESGEYQVSTATFASLATNTALLEATDPAAELPTGGSKLSAINTVYDLPDDNLPNNVPGYIQDPGFLKGAVSKTYNANSTTWYNYDDRGRVTWMVKYLNGLNSYKTVDYTYDGKGNVIKVDYQHGTPNENFVHLYTYDNDSRLTRVQTSAGGGTPKQQANYYYYQHGALKRTELGDHLQGLDYTYTPQGWLKAINSPTGQPANDPGGDGTGASQFSPDAFGMQLEYFPDDYNNPNSSIRSIATGNRYYYNGNVAGMSWQSNAPQPGSPNPPAMYTYTYDEKYQYKNSTWGTPNFTGTPSFTASANNIFSESIGGYDANGNITALQRTDSHGGTATDNFGYSYYPNTNKLASVTNANGASTGGQDYGNYTYDELGRLKSETTIPVRNTTAAVPYYLQYDVTGKITAIYNNADRVAPVHLVESYTYDESGNRIAVITPTLNTFYVYDASGNVLAIYSGGTTPTLKELPVYGSSRLGTYYTTGTRYVYEMRDNVGSVRVAVMDTKDNATGQANIYNFTDYYPYGLLAQSGGDGYRYAYQGAYAETDNNTTYDNFALRMYDARIARWLSIDPMGQFATPYEGMGNNPVSGSDPDGGDWYLSNGLSDKSQAIWFDGSDKIEGYSNIGSSGWSIIPSTGNVQWFNNDGTKSLSAYNLQADIVVTATRIQTSEPVSDDLQRDIDAASKPLVLDAAGNVFRGNVGIDVFKHPEVEALQSPAFDPIDFAGGFAAAGIKGLAAAGIRTVDQYALRAAADGFYPVMERGFANPQELIWLEKDEVWKFGTTKNPLSRYGQKWLIDMGLYYSPEFSGTMSEALILERMKIQNFKWQTGFLPAGNKIIK